MLYGPGDTYYYAYYLVINTGALCPLLNLSILYYFNRNVEGYHYLYNLPKDSKME